MARRPPRSKKEKAPADVEPPKPALGILTALKFILPASREIGSPTQTHVRLRDHWAIAYDEIVALGHPIDEDIYASPLTFRLFDALSKCGQNLQITQLDGRLSIKSEKFRAFVPCFDDSLLPTIQPDPPCAVVNDALKWALEVAGQLASDTGQQVITASVLLNGGSALATDRILMFECWHGIDLPPDLVVPKIAINAIAKIKKSMTQFGFSENSITLYYADGSWLKTHLYSEKWPARASELMDRTCNAWPVPAELFAALDAVAPFSEDGRVRFRNGHLCSHDVDTVGARYEVHNLPNGPVLNAKRLKLIQPYVQHIDFFASTNGDSAAMTMFYGVNLRGLLAGSGSGENPPPGMQAASQ